MVEPVLFVAVGLGAGEGEYRLGDGLPAVGPVVGAGGEVLLVEPGERLGVGGLAVALGVGGSQGLRPLTVGALEQAMRPRKSGGRDGADTGDAVQVRSTLGGAPEPAGVQRGLGPKRLRPYTGIGVLLLGEVGFGDTGQLVEGAFVPGLVLVGSTTLRVGPDRTVTGTPGSTRMPDRPWTEARVRRPRAQSGSFSDDYGWMRIRALSTWNEARPHVPLDRRDVRVRVDPTALTPHARVRPSVGHGEGW
ncbi:hypothetical protein [Streptomyces sp. JL7001]|uniref:hypothetical protein n=1 Tax=Streptomyces sp. JL7001 TaxID=3445784 RepID=UPI003F7AC5B0